jgi:hypothetical protein
MSHLDKLRQAKAHLAGLNKLTDWYLHKSNAFGIFPKPDPQRRWEEFVARLDREPGPDFGLLIGDCLHNLRVTLDHIVWHLVGGNGDAKTAFPIFLHRNDFYAMTKAKKPQPTETSGLRKLRGVPLVPRAIIEDLQPFNQPEPERESLWILHQLENIDKHRVMHASLTALDHSNVHVNHIPKGAAVEVIPHLGAVSDGAVLLEVAFSRPGTQDMGMRVDFDWGVFMDAEILGLPWEPNEILAGLTRAVENVVTKLSPYLP